MLPSWFAPHNFEMLKDRAGEPLTALQIGSYTGEASVWLLENVLTHESSYLVDIDTFEGSDDEQDLDWSEVLLVYLENTEEARSLGKVRLRAETSDRFFDTNREQFDFIYIDGSHHREQVAKDAENAHKALREGGILAFDDYVWIAPHRGDDVPQTAIEDFLAAHSGEYEVLARNNQLWARKRSGPVRIAVYAPCRNEEHHVLDWYESARGADQIVLVDTGSTDRTMEIAGTITDPVFELREACIVPWRFDEGFNAALSQVSPDIDIAVPLHLDERLQPGWREELEKAWRAGGRQFTFSYQFAPALSYMHDRIHARKGYRWKYPAHETPVGPGPRAHTDLRIVQVEEPGSASRSDSSLIHLMLEENPEDSRAQYYSSREYFYANDWEKARVGFQRYLSNPASGYDQERAEACRFMARMVYPQHQEKWHLKACAEAPQRREVWTDLARFYRDAGMKVEAAGAAARALSIIHQTPENSFHCEAHSWTDDWLQELAGLTTRE